MAKILTEFRLVQQDGLFYLYGTGIEKGTILDLLDFPDIRCWLQAAPYEGGVFRLPAQLTNCFLLESSFHRDELNDPVALARHFMSWISRYEGVGDTRSSWDDDGTLWIDWWPAWLNPDIYEPVLSRFEDFR